MPTNRRRTCPSRMSPAVVRLGREALAHAANGRLSATDLVETVLADPRARRWAVTETGLTLGQLRRVIRARESVPPGVTLAWPTEILKSDSDDSLTSLPPELDYSIEEKPKRQRVLSLRQLIRRLWQNTPTELWLRKRLAVRPADFDRGARRAVRALRALRGQDAAIQNLLRRLRAANGSTPPAVVGVISPGGVGVSTALQEIARAFQAKYVQVHPDATGPSDLVSQVGGWCAIAEIPLAGTLSLGSAAYVLLSGASPAEEWPTSSSETTFDSIRNRIFPVLTLVAPLPLSYFDSRPVEELAALAREHYRRDSRDRNEPNPIPDFVWGLFRSSNSVVFSPAKVQDLVGQMQTELESAAKDAATEASCRLTLPPGDHLARLLLSCVPRPSPKAIKGLGREFVERITSALNKQPRMRVILDREIRARLDEMLEPSPEARYRERYTSGRFLSFEVRQVGSAAIVATLTDRVSLAFGAEALVWEHPRVSLAQVVGCERAKELLALVRLYLLDPSEFDRLRARPPTCILLVGSPGNGKTLLAKAFAAECRVTLFYLPASQINGQRYAGEGVQLLTRTFEAAHNMAPSIVFVDELDAIGSRVSLKDGGEAGLDYRANINTLLTLLDGLQSHGRVVVIGATNTPDALDPALVRDGRFGLRVDVDAPNAAERRKLVLQHLDERICPDLPRVLDRIVSQTAGLSCASVVRIVNDAKLRSISRGERLVRGEHVLEAVDEVQNGPRRTYVSSRLRQRNALHEAAHALAGRLLRPEVPLQRVTLVARGEYLGATEWHVGADREAPVLAGDQVMKEIICFLAGPVAERLFFGDHDTGCISDFERAKWLAVFYVRYLDIKEGTRFLFVEEDGQSISAEACRDAAAALIARCMQQAEDILSRHREALVALASELERSETLYAPDVDRILRAFRVRQSGHAILRPAMPSGLHEPRSSVAASAETATRAASFRRR